MVDVDWVQTTRDVMAPLPEVEERLSHGAPTFFVRGKAFVYVWAHGHHDLDYPHLWAAAAPGVQNELVAGDPERFFRPPYVGHRGWIGVRLDHRLDKVEIAEVCEDAFRAVAPVGLVPGARGANASSPPK